MFMSERGRGLTSQRFPDYFRPASVLRPEARAIGPWLTGRTLVQAITPVAVFFSKAKGAAFTKVRTAFWTDKASTDMDPSICLEIGEGIRNETVSDGHILLSLHHESFVGPDRIGEAVASLEKCGREGWHKDFGPVPTIPCQCIPQGFVDQVTKLRGILNLAYPQGEVVEGLPKAVNELRFTEAAARCDDVDLEEARPGYAQPARVTRA